MDRIDRYSGIRISAKISFLLFLRFNGSWFGVDVIRWMVWREKEGSKEMMTMAIIRAYEHTHTHIRSTSDKKEKEA